ncbi:PREDICTED: uncharacterized protein LOC105973324 [Erythranthe guttata]|uniref:uncharacterized protein LOC105973324 n=1 Tax=Erythranthe guttata TaxID=4155 RepID=UPI00064DB177|nr:PREDICTED: uncharacterized protein LOC105973324 [Erythranthe guttata]|eukprot:XP_012853800.1 PREDICTED: uncharacterized protein LOC105973324 [Erythranthe guttata]
MWINKDECEEVVRRAWEDSEGTDPIEKLIQNTRACRTALIQWNRSVGCMPQREIAKTQQRIHLLDSRNQTSEVKKELRELRKKLEHLYNDNDAYWKQRSRIQWMREGDRNTKFFHAKATARKRANTVDKLKDKHGNWQTRGEDIEGVIAEYFDHIFRSTRPEESEIDGVLDCVTPRVTDEANQILSSPFTTQEVTHALFHMAPLKSPGPDGLPVLFFTKYWHILGSSVIACVLDFLNKRILPSTLNFTYIVLIPKLSSPEKITDYRPISLCNVVYKIGSKCIANRLKPILPGIISPTQSAFVSKRLITDNVLVAFEVNHFIRTNTSKNSNFMAVKLDISKAYDRIEWIFLKKTLTRLGFWPDFIDLIMLCLSTVSYSFLFNGSQFGAVTPSRGLRQGDPLSPYLFICCADVLIALIQRAVERDDLSGVKIAPAAPIISNLCFADDTLLFCKATESEASKLKEILTQYALVSGQEINFEKTTMCFSPTTDPDIIDRIHGVLGFHVVDSHDKYLGMPAALGRSRREIFLHLRDRVWSRIKGWGEKHLSRAGKEILIKSVLQAIPSYLMSCFVLPNGLLQEIESAIARFWWGEDSRRKIHWISWRNLCESKRNGGMGFRDLRMFNLALLAKQLWRVLTSPDLLLSRIIRARYFPSGDIFRAVAGKRPSATWQSMLKARPFLIRGLRRRIGDGKDTSIWADPWLRDDGNFQIITRRPIYSSFPDKVADLIDPLTNTWNVELIREHFWDIDQNRILEVPIGSVYAKDRWVWHYSKNGLFSVRSCYHVVMQGTQNSNGNCRGGIESTSGLHPWRWQLIWKVKVPPKIKVFLWYACWGILPTNAELRRRKIIHSPECPRCGSPVESIMHALTECGGMREVWESDPFRLELEDYSSVWKWIEKLQSKLREELFLLAVVVMWKGWETRNKVVHGETGLKSERMVDWSRDYLHAFCQALLPSATRIEATHQSQWKAPPIGSIKINCDVGFPSGKNFYTVAAVARDSEGNCLRWGIRSLEGRPRVEDGEAFVVLHALRMAQLQGWSSIIIEGDCLEVINTFKDGILTLNSFGSFVEEGLIIARLFSHCVFQFVKRSGNLLAHRLATQGSFICTEDFSLPLNLAMVA